MKDPRLNLFWSYSLFFRERMEVIAQGVKVPFPTFWEYIKTELDSLVFFIGVSLYRRILCPILGHRTKERTYKRAGIRVTMETCSKCLSMTRLDQVKVRN